MIPAPTAGRSASFISKSLCTARLGDGSRMCLWSYISLRAAEPAARHHLPELQASASECPRPAEIPAPLRPGDMSLSNIGPSRHATADGKCLREGRLSLQQCLHVCCPMCSQGCCSQCGPKIMQISTIITIIEIINNLTYHLVCMFGAFEAHEPKYFVHQMHQLVVE